MKKIGLYTLIIAMLLIGASARIALKPDTVAICLTPVIASESVYNIVEYTLQPIGEISDYKTATFALG